MRVCITVTTAKHSLHWMLDPDGLPATLRGTWKYSYGSSSPTHAVLASSTATKGTVILHVPDATWHVSSHSCGLGRQDSRTLMHRRLPVRQLQNLR